MMSEFIARCLKPSGNTAKALLLTVAITLLFLDSYGYLDSLKKLLTQPYLTYTVGSFKLSTYLVVRIILISIILFWVTAYTASIGEHQIAKIQNIQQSNKLLLIKIFQIFLYIFAFFIVLEALGIDLTTLTILGGGIGIGVGFGLQKIASNFISGIILLFEKSIEIDDYIELENGILGHVRNLGGRYTLVETTSGKEILIPNEDFITQRVINLTYSDHKARIEITVGVSYQSDLEIVNKILLEAASEYPECLQDPAPSCFLREFGDSSVNFLLYFWIEDVEKGRYGPKSAVMFTIWNKFKEHGIEIPYPQRDVHIKQHKTLHSDRV